MRDIRCLFAFVLVSGCVEDLTPPETPGTTDTGSSTTTNPAPTTSGNTSNVNTTSGGGMTTSSGNVDSSSDGGASSSGDGTSSSSDGGTSSSGDGGTSSSSDGGISSSSDDGTSSSSGGSSSGGMPGVGYGPCPCMGGETEIQLQGVNGCYCAPPCDFNLMNCPDPGTGAAPTCAVTLMAGADPTLCVLICMVDAECPMGATCEPVPGAGASICTHP